jgi:hypothetical protein
MHKRNIEARSRNHCYRGKAIYIKYYVYVSVALVIQHEKRMLRAIHTYIHTYTHMHARTPTDTYTHTPARTHARTHPHTRLHVL